MTLPRHKTWSAVRTGNGLVVIGGAGSVLSNNLLRFIKIYDANIAYKTNKNVNALINALE